MRRLTDDLDQMSLLDYDSLLVNRRRLDVGQAVRDALRAVPGADTVDVRIASGIEALADRARVEQVVANLVENAVRYGEAPIVVSAQRGEGDVVVHVTDRGPGVAPTVESTLFSRLSLTGVPRRGMRGPLGLALVRGLVEAMGGRVWYEPVPEGGARFSFTLPAP